MGQINKPQEYDNPYRVLAAHIVSAFSVPNIKRALSSSSYIKSLIIHEAKTMDVSGAFIDCIDQEIIAHDRIRRKNACMRQLGEFYFSELDLERLRKEIRRFAEEFGISLD